MTGIERLYKLIADIDVSADPELWYILRGGTEGGWDCEKSDGKTLDSTLAAIADQIKREQGEHVSRMRVLSVVTEMERHVSGVEGMEDSPVARWARELREALGAGHDHADDVSMSAYDLLSQADREAIAWVREHGGLDAVKAEWRSRVPHDLYERRRQRLLGHIAECETALGRRNQRIEELVRRVGDLTSENAELRKRLMPEGCEWLIEAWPKFEDDAPVKLGDMALIDGDIDMVEAVQIWIHGKPAIYGDNGSQQLEKGERVKRPSVLAADGEPLEVGQTVWHVINGIKFTVVGLINQGEKQVVKLRLSDDGSFTALNPDQLTHTKPDSWDALWDDIENCAVGYESFMRRCSALAERERGE